MASHIFEKSPTGEDSKFCVVLGAQWGDEGKGKLVDILAQNVQLCARFNGGANAGHTLVVEGKKYAFHLLPCGMINKACKNLIGNGVVVHIPTLMKEIQELKEFDSRALERIFISTRAHVLFDSHQIIDGILEAEQGTNSIGTTKRGIGPCYSAKAIRNGLRFGDLLHFDEFERRLRELIAWSQKRFGDPRERDTPAQLQLRKALREYNTKYAFDPEGGKKGGVESIDEEVARYRQFADLLRHQIVDSVTLIHEDISRGYKVLVEGANAALLDIDFGTYPFVTSSNTTVGSVCTGLGVPPKQIDTIIGVVKAYTTRVGHGPFPTELQNEAQSLQDHMEMYVGPQLSLERKGHSSGPYTLTPGQQVKVGEMLQEVGHEYGTTTGRRRRCGWLDLALVKYSAMVNGFDSINITKLDVLTGLKQLRVAIAYRNSRMTEDLGELTIYHNKMLRRHSPIKQQASPAQKLSQLRISMAEHSLQSPLQSPRLAKRSMTLSSRLPRHEDTGPLTTGGDASPARLRRLAHQIEESAGPGRVQLMARAVGLNVATGNPRRPYGDL